MNDQASNPFLDRLPGYSLLRNEQRKASLKTKGVRVFDFGLGDPLEPTPEFINEALQKHVPTISQYPSAVGSPALRKAFAKWMLRRFDVSLDIETQVISSNGSKEAIFHAPLALLNPCSTRRIIVYPDPGFPVYKSSILLSGGVGLRNSLDPQKNYIFDPKSIPVELLNEVAAVWVSYPHNPTGACITLSEMEGIYEWALKHNIVLLSDECYVDMYFPGTAAPHSFLEVSRSENFRNVVSFHTLSKRSGMTGFRTGCIAGDAKLVQSYAKLRPNIGVGTPEFVQAAAIVAWDDDSHVFERSLVFSKKRQLVEAFLDKNKIVYLPSTATFYVWIKSPERFTDGEQFAQELANRTGIIATPGDALGESSASWIRLALVPNLAETQEALNLWQRERELGNL